MGLKKFRHKLKGNKTVQIPSRLIFYDTETWLNQAEDLIYCPLRLGVACYVRTDRNEERWLVFKEAKQFWEWIDKQINAKEKVLVFSHNQHFDFNVVEGFKLSYQYGWELKKWIFDSQRFIVKFKKDNRYLVFLDSGNIIKEKLENLGKAIELKKLKVDFDTVNDKDLIEYCKRDVEILKRFILHYIDFIKQHELGCFKYTIASQAFQAFKHRFMHHDIYVHDNKIAIDLERRSYRGGRNECFVIGKLKGDNFYLLDVNSMYPFVMKEFDYPVRLKFVSRNCDENFLKELLKKYCVIADVNLTTEENVFGVKLKKLIFPIGTFNVTLCTNELKYALQNCRINKIGTFVVYEKARIFKDYVDFFYKLKKEYKEKGDSVRYMLTKLFLNSLYGKFGQKVELFELVGETDKEYWDNEKIWDMEDKRWIHQIILNGKIYEKTKEEEGFDSIVAIASEVTANARMTLWNYMKKAGLENVYYVDTDSLLVNSQGFTNLRSEIDPVKLGKLSIELVTDRVELRGLKDYTIGEKYKIKGIKNNAEYLGNNTYRQQQFLKTRTLLRGGIIDKACIKIVTKKLERNYDKGKLLPDGRVTPFLLPQELQLVP